MKKAVAEKVKKQFVAMLTSPERFQILDDGWIRDAFLDLEWGPSSESEMNFAKAVKYCAKEGGRLPEAHELFTLVNLSKNSPAAPKAFKDMKSSWYWSNTKTSWSASAAWCVSFYCGSVSLNGVDIAIYVRPVRASQC